MKQSNSIFKAAGSFILFALMLANLSCSTEDIESSAAGNGDFAINILLPREMGTRASFGDGDKATINTLHWTLFEIESDGNNPELVVSQTIDAAFGDGEASIHQLSIPLVIGNKYQLAICAMNSENQLVSYEDGKIKMHYDRALSNNLNEDVFTGVSEIIDMTKGGDFSASITLTRPLAQLNWGSTDLEETTVLPYMEETLATVTVNSGLYSCYDILNGGVTGEIEEAVVFPAFSCSSLPSQTFPTGGAPAPKLIAMNYLLTANGSSTIDASLTLSNSLDIEVEVNSAPVQSNYRTNVYGAMVTNSGDVSIEMTKAFNSSINSQNIRMNSEFEQQIVDDLVAYKDIYIPEGCVVDLTNRGYFTLKDGQTLTIDGTLILGMPKQLRTSAESGITPTVTIQGNGTVYLDNDVNPIMINKGTKGIFRNVRIECMPNVTYGSAIYSEGELELHGVYINTNRYGVAVFGNKVTAEECVIHHIGNNCMAVSLENGACGELKNCKIISKNNHAIRIWNNSEMVIDGGRYESVSGNTIYMVDDNTSLTILGGEFLCKLSKYPVYSEKDAEISMMGGKYTYNKICKKSCAYDLPAAEGYKMVALDNDPEFKYQIVEK